jgi:flagellin
LQARAKEILTMSMSILNNISALNAENSLSTTQTNLQNTLTQLATGQRINSGADDAAGLSIANGMNANIAALTQSGQNATNTTGLLQTADGALSQVTSLLNRAVTLATEASTDGLTGSQSDALNTEFTSILASINSIGQNTTFNGANVFSSNVITPFLGDGDAGNDMLGGETMDVGTLSTNGVTGLNLNAAASATVQLSATPVASGDTFTLGATTYTLQSSTVPITGAGQIQVGATNADTLQNIVAAVNGTDGTGFNPANAVATAAAGGTTAAPTLTFTATTAGLGDGATTGNTAAFAATFNSVASSATTLTGGAGDATLSTPAEAQSALVAITSAISSISQTRGAIGADINQLSAASNVMTGQVTNLQSTDNGIMNADIGKTVANMTQYNILQSTGMSALQQANQAQQAILKLLQ